MDLSVVDIRLILVICCLCGAGIAFFVGFQLIGGAVGLLAGGLSAIVDLIVAGPAAWCGCLVAVAGLFICGGMVMGIINILSTCGTPDAVNFCRLF